MERALVLGGGGIAGIAWEIGILAGLRAAGTDVTGADLVVGTSAGSVVGSLITIDGVDLEALYLRQLGAPTESVTPFDGARMFAALADAAAGATSRRDARVRIGAYAIANRSAPDVDRHAVITSRLSTTEWPRSPFLVTAVDAESGDLVAFDRESGVALVDAVTASCSVPGVWTPATIDGRRYIDGGVHSIVNAELAEGHERILVLAPMPGMGFQNEIRRLEHRGSRVLVVYGDADTRAVFGTNPLDPATQAPAVRAGYAQAASVVGDVAALWKS